MSAPTTAVWPCRWDYPPPPDVLARAVHDATLRGRKRRTAMIRLMLSRDRRRLFQREVRR